jgi:SAM-dependent methyltransferase
MNLKLAIIKIFGFPVTLILRDTLVLDRWLWLKKRLPQSTVSKKLIDIGCAKGAFTIGAALRSYEALGVNSVEEDISAAIERAFICRANSARLEVMDVRRLDQRHDLISGFDVVLCLEVIEHLLDDCKLIKDMTRCLKPGGRLLLTTPNYYYKPISPSDNGSFSSVEDGGHVRRGYTKEDLEKLCKEAGIVVDNLSFCSGFLSPKITFFYRELSRVHEAFGASFILPLRILPPLLDPLITKLTRWPGFSICLEAHKPDIDGI